MPRYETVIKNGHVLIEDNDDAVSAAIGIRDGRIVALAEDLPASDADEVIDASGLLVLPGAVDSHFHLGIYRSVSDDAESETASALVGGTTTIISYFRTGGHYMERSGPYREILPALLDATAGRAHTDYAYHLAPMTQEHLSELDWLTFEMGVTSYKFFLSYIGLGVDPASERYDVGYLYQLMSAVAGLNAKAGAKNRVSLSVHCEDASLISLFERDARELAVAPLEQYSLARPTLGEALAIHQTAHLAQATGAPVNLLHLSSSDALDAVRRVRGNYPQLDVRAETAPHYLTLFTHEVGDVLGGKVNPPLRTSGDGTALWDAIASGDIDWVATDHCCSAHDRKGPGVWEGVPGFGGAALLYPMLLSEGHVKRGLPLGRIVELASRAPAKAYGCYGRKGRIGLGADADLVLVDPQAERVVSPELVHSAQDHSPFTGQRVQGWPVRTLLRGHTVARDGEPTGPARGEFLHRPLGPQAGTH